MKKIRAGRMQQRAFFLLLFATTVLFARRAAAQVVVIVNPGVKASEVSSADLRDVFTGVSSSFREGSHVTPVLLKAGPVNEDFLKLYVGKSDAALRAGWLSLLFSGQGAVPRTIGSEAAMIEYVAHTPGAIGYVGKATPHEGVKVLSVR